MASETTKEKNINRAKIAKENHEKASKDRADTINKIHVAFLNGNWDIIYPNLIEKITGFQKYHIKIAQDGVGARTTGYKLEDGSPEVENIYLTASQRASHLDKAAGLEEILDYLNRMTIIPDSIVENKKKEVKK
jgi:hypothetical protein